MKSVLLVNGLILGASSSLLISCGNQATQFSSPGYSSASYSISGMASDKARSIKKALETADAKSVLVESGMSESEKMKADAEEKAILETLFPPASDKNGAVSEADASAVTTNADVDAAAKSAAEAAAKAESDAAAKSAAEVAAQAASNAAAKAAAEAAAKSAADAAAQRALAEANAAKAAAAAAKTEADATGNNEARARAAANESAAAEAAARAQVEANAAAQAAADAAAKAAADAQAKANADAAAAKAAADAAKAANDAAKAQVEAAARAAAKRAHERDEEEKKKRSDKKSEDEEREEDDDKRDFSDDGDFETALPRTVVGDNATAFMEACAQSMKVDKKKLVIAGEGKGNLNRDSVLVVYAVGGSLTVKPEGEKFRGLCVFASGGANVTVNAGKTRVNGLYIYERGNNNKTNANFSDSGRFKSGVVMYSGNSNAVTIKGVNDCKCKKLKVYGSPGSVVCGKR